MAKFPIIRTNRTISGEGSNVRSNLNVSTGAGAIGQAVSGLGATISAIAIKDRQNKDALELDRIEAMKQAAENELDIWMADNPADVDSWTTTREKLAQRVQSGVASADLSNIARQGATVKLSGWNDGFADRAMLSAVKRRAEIACASAEQMVEDAVMSGNPELERLSYDRLYQYMTTNVTKDKAVIDGRFRELKAAAESRKNQQRVYQQAEMKWQQDQIDQTAMNDFSARLRIPRGSTNYVNPVDLLIELGNTPGISGDVRERIAGWIEGKLDRDFKGIVVKSDFATKQTILGHIDDVTLKIRKASDVIQEIANAHGDGLLEDEDAEKFSEKARSERQAIVAQTERDARSYASNQIVVVPTLIERLSQYVEFDAYLTGTEAEKKAIQKQALSVMQGMQDLKPKLEEKLDIYNGLLADELAKEKTKNMSAKELRAMSRGLLNSVQLLSPEDLRQIQQAKELIQQYDLGKPAAKKPEKKEYVIPKEKTAAYAASIGVSSMDRPDELAPVSKNWWMGLRNQVFNDGEWVQDFALKLIDKGYRGREIEKIIEDEKKSSGFHIATEKDFPKGMKPYKKKEPLLKMPKELPVGNPMRGY